MGKKKPITLTGKAAQDAFVEKLNEVGIKRVSYPVYPLRDGYKRVGYSLDGKQRPLYGPSEDPLNEKQKEFVLFFTGGVWNMGRLSAFLQQHCNVTDPAGLTWKNIFDHLIVLAQAKHITVETIDKYPSVTFSGSQTQQPTIEYSLPLPMTKWAEILDLSENTLRNIREGEEPQKYHFVQVTPRRWILPKHELPTEYLEKYRHSIPQNHPMAQ